MMSAPSSTAPGNPASAPVVAQRQVRRAWVFLSTAALTFVVACGGLGGAGYWYRGHATEKRTVCVEVYGERAFVRPAYQKNWSAIPARTGGAGCATGTPILLNELDALQTRSGTQVLLTFWDNSTVQVFENTEVQMTELRTTRYIGRASAVSLRQVRGLILVTLGPGDYRRSRFQVNAGEATVLIKEGDGSAGGSFLVQATASDSQDEDAPVTVRASVRRGIGAVRVAGYPGELRLGANEQTIVPPGGPAGDPTPARHDFVANSRFEPVGAGGCDIKGPFAPWQGSCTPGLVDGKFGTLTTVADMIDDQPVSALEIYRSTASTDPANTGLRQVLDVSVADQPSLSLTADIKVLEQNVPGGGQLGSEFPIIVRINYYDGLTGTPITRTWGFYILPAANGAVPTNPSLVEARQVPAGQWVPLRFDLRGLSPQPVRLESIEVYASGQGYRARITNVAIIGSE
jgi:hypothetical protein